MSQVIADAARVKQIMEESVMDAAFKRVSIAIYEEFRAADSSEKRVTAWAKANALEAILMELRAVQGAGEREVLDQAKRAPKQKEK